MRGRQRPGRGSRCRLTGHLRAQRASSNSETTSAWARCRWRTSWSRVPAVRNRGRFRKGLGQCRKSGRCNLARSGRDRRSSHLLCPSWVDSPRNEVRPHERTPESSEAASHMDSPDRNWFAKLALYHNHSWCAGHRSGAGALSAEHPQSSGLLKRCHFQNARLGSCLGIARAAEIDHLHGRLLDRGGSVPKEIRIRQIPVIVQPAI
jgi:hypothetical protein